MRQALAGMLWSKQFYHYDVDQWLREHGSTRSTPTAAGMPQRHWLHMHNGDVISMPDKWEYPWFAAWDLAFHGVPLAHGRPRLRQGPAGAACSASATCTPTARSRPTSGTSATSTRPCTPGPPLRLPSWSRAARRGRRRVGCESTFQKLLLNFTWWVNRKDPTGKNVFEGGFLGLDNIGVFDRSAPLPTGGYLEQADGTAWMALYCQNMLRDRRSSWR